MAKLNVVLFVILLAVLILTCVEGNKPRRGKNRSNNRQKETPEKIREEIRRVPKASRHGEESPFPISSNGEYGLPNQYSVANLKETLKRYLYRGYCEGPNVCQNETMDTFNDYGIGSAGSIRLEDLSSKQCYVYGEMYKCTIIDRVTDIITAYTIICECCHGYSRGVMDYEGCPIKITESNLIKRLEELGLTDFLEAVKILQITNALQTGNFTLFVPENGAFSLDSDLIGEEVRTILKNGRDVIEASDQAAQKALQSFKKAILSHMVPAIRKISSLGDEDVVETASPDGATIRINHFTELDTWSGSHLKTANCVPIRTSEIATNGYIHRVDKVLKPVTQSLLDIISSRPELSKLSKALEIVQYQSKLEKDGHMTILAVPNFAYGKPSKYLRGTDKCLQKFLLNHMFPNVICAEAVKGNMKTINNLRNNINVTKTEDNKLFFNDAQVVQSDVMGTNGVIHIIDKPLVPDEALGLSEVLKKEGLTEFLKLIKRTDLRRVLDESKYVTVFAPSNEAIKSLPDEVKKKLIENPNFMRSLLTSHVVQTEHHISHSTTLKTLDNQDIRIQVSDDPLGPTKTVGCAAIKKVNIEYCGGLLNIINGVIMPSIGNVIDVLSKNQQFSKFVSLIKMTSLFDVLQGMGPFTVFAPNDQAFGPYDVKILREYFKDIHKLENFIKHHIIGGNACCAKIVNRASVMNKAGNSLILSSSPSGVYHVGDAVVKSCDQTATNGIVWELDRVPMVHYHDPLKNPPFSSKYDHVPVKKSRKNKKQKKDIDCDE